MVKPKLFLRDCFQGFYGNALCGFLDALLGSDAPRIGVSPIIWQHQFGDSKMGRTFRYPISDSLDIVCCFSLTCWGIRYPCFFFIASGKFLNFRSTIGTEKTQEKLSTSG